MLGVWKMVRCCRMVCYIWCDGLLLLLLLPLTQQKLEKYLCEMNGNRFGGVFFFSFFLLSILSSMLSVFLILRFLVCSPLCSIELKCREQTIARAPNDEERQQNAVHAEYTEQTLGRWQKQSKRKYTCNFAQHAMLITCNWNETKPLRNKVKGETCARKFSVCPDKTKVLCHY